MSIGPGPGWYPDPSDRSGLDERYWNGSEWTDLTRLAEGGALGPGQPTEPDARGEPSAEHRVGAHEVLVTIGEVSCTATSVMTPNGSFPIRGTEWIIHDGTRMSRHIPAYAIVLAIVFTVFCCGLGLLFLSFQEDVYSGSVDVTVRDKAGDYFATSIPVRNANVISDVHTRVNYCRYLAGL